MVSYIVCLYELHNGGAKQLEPAGVSFCPVNAPLISKKHDSKQVCFSELFWLKLLFL